MLPPPLSTRTRPAWSTPCSISSRTSCARPNSPAADRPEARANGRSTPDETSAEERLIARYFRPLATHPGAFGLADDAAILTPPPGCDLVLTTDGVIAGVHFFPDDPPDTIGRKALRMNLSDLAAKGAKPLGFLHVGRIAGAGSRSAGSQHFAAGLGEDAQLYRLSASWRRYRPHARADFGLDRGLRRCAARTNGAPLDREGRRLCRGHRHDRRRRAWRVAAARSTVWRELCVCPRRCAHLQDRYLLPQPRNALAEAVLQHASAAMDVSDGLAGDLAKLCRASRSPPKSTLRVCRFPTLPAPRSRPIRR